MDISISPQVQTDEQNAPRLTTFYLFSKLPVDIQYYFWQKMVDWVGPRTVVIASSRNHHRDRYGRLVGTSWNHNLERKEVPVVLQICQTSRSLAERKYKLVLGTMRNNHPIRFNVELDKIYLTSCTLGEVNYTIARLDKNNECRKTDLNFIGKEL